MAALTERSTALTNEVLNPCAKTATNTTTPKPIMRAAAVAAVRAGLRVAFSRASRPLLPAKRAAGQPITLARGRTTYLATMATATKMSTAPSAISSRRLPVVPCDEHAGGQGGGADARRRPRRWPGV